MPVPSLVSDGSVVLVDRTNRTETERPLEYAFDELSRSIDGRGGSIDRVGYWTETDAETVLVVGRTDEQVVDSLLDESVSEPESVVFQWADTGSRTALVVAGSDTRGLVYALLELAERVDDGGLEALDAVENVVETPDNEVRGVDRFVAGPQEDEWFFDDEFWHTFFDRLVRARFNRFVLIVGFDTAYFSPPYPFLVDVPGYPDVRVDETLDVDRDTHRERLRRIGDLCHRYGLEFVFATWQQRPWRDDDESLVHGLPADEAAYAEYCATGIRTIVEEFPVLDGVQLRVNFESGVGDRSTAQTFWRELVEGIAAAADGRTEPLELDLRAKGLTDEMIRHAQETGIELTVSTKYWCESTGLPYHLTQMRRGELENLDDMNRHRRYSYSNLLEKPRTYDVLYRLWAAGTNRLFLWGDPDYARRFSHSTDLGDSRGFEVVTPLCLKGGRFFVQRDRGGGWPLFDDSDLRHYEWEDDRYWAWYLLFGRLGYSRDTDPDVWERAFRARFDDAATDVLAAYRAASKVLPLLTAAHLTRHPMLINWAELDTGGALFGEHNHNSALGDVTYASAEPSDPGLFYAIDEYVTDVIAEELSHKYTPLQIARWLERFAQRATEAIDRAAETLEAPSAEFTATALDVRMIADLATYHASKTRAATALCHYEATDRTQSVQDAEVYMRRAVDAWESLAERGDGTYHDDLVFALGEDSADCGTWADRVEELNADLDELETMRTEANASRIDRPAGVVPELDSDSSVSPARPRIELDVPTTCRAGTELPVDVRTDEFDEFDGMTLYYRRTNQAVGAFQSVEMNRTAWGYHATIPAEEVTSEWDMLVYVATVDDGNTVLVPGLYHPDRPAPYRIVDVQ
ncbi:hypothetical protein OB955_15170 [Halobacteria archaeon AArc-m2/3/4]|uniref:Alpha glucuronidase N-terminal domain-containing protein n=1 Tax=Natronoglomus mannanivorans TaxID=2979990 RepID=A0ABT2QGL5_9EURY|nr:hypothetical protein [Halobacteria archaeon AArc-m2/3/4]